MSTYKDKYIKYKKKYIDLKYRMTGGTTINCPACTFKNIPTATKCDICNTELQKHKIDKKTSYQTESIDEIKLLSLKLEIQDASRSDKGYLIFLIKKFINKNYNIKEENIPSYDIEDIVDTYKKNENNIDVLISQMKKVIEKLLYKTIAKTKPTARTKRQVEEDRQLELRIARDERRQAQDGKRREKCGIKPKLVIHTLGLSNLDDKTFYGLWKEKIEPKILTKLLEHYDIKFIHYDETFDKNITIDNEEFKKENFDIKKFEELKKSPNETHLIINMAGGHIDRFIQSMHQNLFLDIPFIPDFSKIERFNEFKLIDYSIKEKRITTVSEAMMKGTDGKYIDRHIVPILYNFENKLKKSMNKFVPKIFEGKEQEIRTEVFKKLDEKLKNLKHEIYHKIYIEWKNIDIAFSEIEKEMNEFINKLI